MSAFIVDDFTMHRALMGYSYAMRQRGYYVDDLTALGRKWLAMNVEAVVARYGSRAFEGDAPDVNAYRFKLIGDRHPADYFKALKCLQYQCTEGDVPDSTTYRELEGAVSACASRLISEHIPAYEHAPWDGETSPRSQVVAA